MPLGERLPAFRVVAGVKRFGTTTGHLAEISRPVIAAFATGKGSDIHVTTVAQE
jgi:hypothetical protein